MDKTTARDPRGELREDEETIALIDHPDSTEEIPTLDFAPYLEGRPGGMDEVAAKLREVSMTVGFFYLKNHGIPQKVIDDIFAESRRFHALPESEKEKVARRDVNGHRLGYKGYGTEGGTSNTGLLSNVKPSHYAQVSFAREAEGEPSLNRWPENLPGFKEKVLVYHRAAEKLARSFLPLWAKGLKLPLSYFDAWFQKPHFQLGLLHYPPQKEVGNKQYGIPPHTDNAMMTFLAQSTVPGLAVRMPSGHWRTVEPVPGTLLVNTGNTIVQWTNEDYLSTKHRVINTNTVDRYSIPIFFGPSDDTVIEVVPTCRGPERPPLYEPMTYANLRKWYYGRD